MGNLTLPGGPQAAFGQFETYEPFIIVDVADLSAETALANTDNGEVMDVNDELFGCGWYEDGSEVCQPFYLDPRDGGSALTLPMEIGETSYQSGAAFALSESTGFDMSEIVIVGWVEEDAGNPEAAYWTNDGTDWSLHLVPTLTGMDSKAYGISDDGAVIVGWFDYLGVTSRPFTCDISGPTTVQWWNIPGDAYGTDDDGGFFVGTKLTTPPLAYFFDRSTLSDLTIDDYEETYAFDINDVGLVVGYAVDTTTYPALYDGVIWYYDDLEEEWASYIFSQDNPDPVDSSLTAISNELEDGAVDIVGTYFDGAVPDGVFYVTVNSSGSYKSYSLDAVTSGQNAHLPLALFPLRIRLNVEEYSWTPQTYSARGINRIATIAGSYLDGASSNAQIRPCLYVANDLDNNGLPDIREILQGRLLGTPLELDDNDNWMLDRAELMRVGLHSPGYDSPLAPYIPYNQIVRLPLHLELLPVESIPEGEYALNAILSGDECDFREDIEDWTRGTGDREAIIWMRSTLGANNDFDYLPEDEEQRDSILADLREFGYLYAHCIDWVQLGNEVFGGSGQYYFRPGELSSGSGPFGGLTEQQQEEAVEVILEWIEAQSQAVREGSALAGRALRVIGPAVTHQNVYNGYTEENAGRYITTRMADWVNENRAYFDMHTHWTTVSMATAAAHRLMGTGGTTPPWDPPYRAVTLEWGPRANDAWMFARGDEFTDFRVDEGCETPPCCEDDPEETWDDFVGAWQVAQFYPATDFGFADVLEALDAAGFNAACYGPTGMHSPSSMAYDMACLIANKVCEDFLDPYREPDPRATLLYDEYVAEVEQYEIDGFEPHPDTCPQCEQQ